MGAKFILGACLWIFSLVFAEFFKVANGIKPQSYGIVLFRAFDTLDVYAPIEVLQMVSNMHKIDIFLISETNDPVTTAPMSAMMNPYNSSVWYTLPTAHTFETAPKEFDVLIVPGGPGIRSPYLNSTLKYIRETTPNAKHVITICTGAGLAARAGILNGKKVENR